MDSDIKIQIPVNNQIERRYIVDVLFGDYLGLSYELQTSEELTDWTISVGGKTLIIRDCFWSAHSSSLAYLNLNYLPHVFFVSNNSFIVENDLPILYGTDEFSVTDKGIDCGIDLFASSFFMLTRWEEYVNPVRDRHDRFPATASVANRYNFLHRPVVNEYVEMLWNMLKALGYKEERKKQTFEIILTHDIDTIRSKNVLKMIAGDILKRRDFGLAFYHIGTLFKEPVNMYSFLMQQSEKIGIKSHFYFMAVKNEKNEFDTCSYLNTVRFKKIFKKIKARGHFIGFHPGYMTFNDEKRWRAQKCELEDVLGENVFEGRQHYLRFEVPKTWVIWNKQGMKVDRTLGYADKEGFRCGTGNYFPVYDFLERKVLNLCECPLIVMEGTLRNYNDLSIEECRESFLYYIRCAKKYKMPVTFLFHNSSFDNYVWKGWKQLYIDILSRV